MLTGHFVDQVARSQRKLTHAAVQRSGDEVHVLQVVGCRHVFSFGFGYCELSTRLQTRDRLRMAQNPHQQVAAAQVVDVDCFVHGGSEKARSSSPHAPDTCFVRFQVVQTRTESLSNAPLPVLLRRRNLRRWSCCVLLSLNIRLRLWLLVAFPLLAADIRPFRCGIRVIRRASRFRNGRSVPLDPTTRSR